MKCNNCGNDLNGGEKFCKSCGQPVNASPQPSAIPIKPVSPKKKKGHGCLIAVIVVLVIIGIIAAGLFIFLPELFAPKDLKIQSSREAYESALAKLSFVKDEAPTSDSAQDYVYTYGEPQQVDISLSSEELTSFFNENRPDYYALKDVQVRVNTDNTIEMSAAIDTDYIMNTVLSGKYSEEEIKKAVPALGLLPKTVNVYTHVSGEIADNNSAGIDIQKVEVMGVALPSELYASSSAKSEINSLLDSFLSDMSEKTGGSFDSIKIEDGELKFSGMIPTALERKQAG